MSWWPLADFLYIGVRGQRSKVKLAILCHHGCDWVKEYNMLYTRNLGHADMLRPISVQSDLFQDSFLDSFGCSASIFMNFFFTVLISKNRPSLNINIEIGNKGENNYEGHIATGLLVFTLCELVLAVLLFDIAACGGGEFVVRSLSDSPPDVTGD